MPLLERPLTTVDNAADGVRVLAPAVADKRGNPAHVPGRSARRPGRDVFLDLLRAWATLSVMIVHWLMPQASWDGHTLAVTNVLGDGPGWVATWVFQVIPLMFFVAGAATFSQLSRARVPWRDFVTTRIRRILPPVVAFLGTWAVAAVVLPWIGVPGAAVSVAATIAPQLLWYLGIYVLLLAASHGLRRAYRRWGLAAVVGLGAAAVLVDGLRFLGGVEPVGVANLFLVWAFAYTLGYAYADGRLRGLAPRTTGAVALLGLFVLVLAVTVGPYPVSMVGMPGDAISNMGPPTLCIVALTVVQVFAALTLRPVILALAERPAIREIVGWVSARSMTLYLWHLTALFVVVGVLTVGLGIELPAGWTATWWATRPAFFLACVLVLGCFVRGYGRIEGRRLSSAGRGSGTADGAPARPAPRPAPDRAGQRPTRVLAAPRARP